MAAIRHTLNNAMAHVNTYKTGGAGLAGFETQAQKDSFHKTYAPASVAVTRAALSTAVGGSPRIQPFTLATMSGANKITVGLANSSGVLQMSPGLLAAHSVSGSYCVHEGEKASGGGDFIIEDGTTLYWIPGTAPDETDFINYKKLLEYYMAYAYISDAVSLSTLAEKNASLAGYEAFRDDASNW